MLSVNFVDDDFNTRLNLPASNVSSDMLPLLVGTCEGRFDEPRVDLVEERIAVV